MSNTDFIAFSNLEAIAWALGPNLLILPNNFQTSDLPYIFGKPEIQEFLQFKKIVDRSKFSFDEIDSLYFFPSKRWDIKLKNNILLKLSNNSTMADLNYAYE